MLNSSRNVNWKKKYIIGSKLGGIFLRTSSTLNITIILWSVGILSFCYSGTRPDRTIVFCAWGAEEHGLIGSTEWVEVLSFL